MPEYVCTCGSNEYCAADDCHGATAARIRLWLLTFVWRLTGRDLSRKPLDHEVGA